MSSSSQSNSSLSALEQWLTVRARPRVVCLGDVMLDRYAIGDVRRISPEAPIPVLSVAEETSVPGGAANTARNAAAMGSHVILLGIVGADAEGHALEKLLSETEGVDACLVRATDRPTTVKTRFVSDAQQLLRADRERCAPVPQAIADAIAEQLDSALDGARALLISDYAKGLLVQDLVHRAIEAARRAQVPVLVDPKPRPAAEFAGAGFQAYRGADLLKPNLAEMRRVSGERLDSDRELETVGERVARDAGVGALLVTRAERGASLIRPGLPPLHVASRARSLFDVSGAGDSVLACLGTAVASGLSLEDAVPLANAAGGIAVEKAGTAVVSRNEILAVAAERGEGALSAGAIWPVERAAARAAEWRALGLSVGFTNGCFDLLHPGHVSLIDRAARQCDRLVVGVNSDASVRRLKGSDRPVLDERARALLLSSLAAVDAVVLFAEDTPLALIEALRPDVLFKGSDYRREDVVGGDRVERWGGRVVLLELEAGYSTSETIRRIQSGRE